MLHVGFNPIGSGTNTGLTLGSMFETWPEEALFELYLPSRQGSGPARRRVLSAPSRVAPVDSALRAIVGSRIPSPIPDGLNNSIAGRNASLPLRYRLRAHAATMNEVGPVTARGAWLDPVASFKPDVIHSPLGSVRATKLVTRIASRLGVPVVPHFMDDWPATMFADGRLLGLPRSAVERSFRQLMRHVPICLVIGEDMRDEFEDRLARPCRVVGNSVDFSEADAEGAVPPGNDVTVLTYVGGLHLGRDQAVVRVARAAGSAPSLVKIKLYTPAGDATKVDELAQRYPGIVEAAGTVAPNEVPRVLREADILLFMESNDPRISNFTRLSVSTKVPEYLAARRPILAVGPPDQSSIRALRRGPATEVSIGEPQDLSRALRAVISMTGGPIEPITGGLRELFDRQATQRRLYEALISGLARNGARCE